MCGVCRSQLSLLVEKLTDDSLELRVLSVGWTIVPARAANLRRPTCGFRETTPAREAPQLLQFLQP